MCDAVSGGSGIQLTMTRLVTTASLVSRCSAAAAAVVGVVVMVTSCHVVTVSGSSSSSATALRGEFDDEVTGVGEDDRCG